MSRVQSGVNPAFNNQQLQFIQWKVNATGSGNNIEPMHYTGQVKSAKSQKNITLRLAFLWVFYNVKCLPDLFVEMFKKNVSSSLKCTE